MKYLLLVAALFVAQAQAAKEEAKLDITASLIVSDMQHYIHKAPGKWPYYSGAFGFGYPYKTAPQAAQHNNITYFTYSKCITTNTQNYMIVYAADSLGNKTAVRRVVSSKCDPHENASIMIDNEGYVKVYQSARGKWRKGFVFKSTEPNSIRAFTTVDSGYYAYPKPHEKGLVYTDYNGILRETWVKNETCEKQLVKGGGYSITTEHNGEIHMVYNYHFAGNLNARVNLYYMWSPNGCDWYNNNGYKLNLPVSENSNVTAISFEYSKFNYLKQLAFIDGEMQALVVQSTSNDPTKGSRELVKFTMDGEKKAITNMGHSYDGAQFWRGGIVAVKSNEHGYAGGYLYQYTLDGEYIGTFRGEGAANYPVAIKGTDKLMFADTESSSITSEANIYIVE